MNSKELYPEDFENCNASFRHENFLVDPKILKENSIVFNKIEQKVGEFVSFYTLKINCHFFN